MKQEKRRKVEYRYYEVPQDVPVLALLGEGWIRPYGEEGLLALHFHNHLEIGYCYEGCGQLALGDEVVPYGPQTLTVVPRNVCHTTVSENQMLCRNEYLFIDAEGFVGSLPEEERRFGEKLLRHINRRAHCAQPFPKPRAGRRYSLPHPRAAEQATLLSDERQSLCLLC